MTAHHGWPATFTDTLLAVVVPVPSWPWSFFPQQYRPVVVTPQVWLPPALTERKLSPRRAAAAE